MRPFTKADKACLTCIRFDRKLWLISGVKATRSVLETRLMHALSANITFLNNLIKTKHAPL